MFFFKKTIFSNEIFSRKPFLNDERHKKEMIKTFFCKCWRDGFFRNTKRFPDNEIWTIILLLNPFLCGIFSEIEKSFFWKRELRKKSKKKTIDFFSKKKNRNSENKFLEVLHKWFFCQKKKVNLSCSKEHAWKKGGAKLLAEHLFSALSSACVLACPFVHLFCLSVVWQVLTQGYVTQPFGLAQVRVKRKESPSVICTSSCCMFWAARVLHWCIQRFLSIPFSTWTHVVFRSCARARYTDGGRGYCSGHDKTRRGSMFHLQ